ncbi:macrolide ABC transporter permease [Clostridia bacterium]|nr:macrolide ABC transporter permease [Clostridia bacterium]
MNIKDTIRSSISSIISNKMRSILTMLGIIIGISSVIMITSVGNGFKANINNYLSKFSSSGIQIGVNSEEGVLQADLLSMKDVERMLQIPNISAVAPVSFSGASVALKNPNESATISLSATSGDYQQIERIDLLYGRFLVPQDMTHKNQVIVIGEELAKKVFGRSDVLGETLDITLSYGMGKMSPTIVGVTKAPDQQGPLSAVLDGGNTGYIPLPSLNANTTNGNVGVSYILIAFDNDDDIAGKVNMIKRFLEITHKNHKKYDVSALSDQIGTINSVMSGITAFISFVAAISLIVGGIGVMNIMLVTVTERTREIGIRKSIGATDFNISFQFLIEAMVMTLIGGLIGVALGYAGAVAVAGFMKFSAILSMPMLVIACVVSILTGIIFGVYPAQKAAKMNPIDALRYD